MHRIQKRNLVPWGMCAQYLLKARAKQLEKLFGIQVPMDFDQRFTPHSPAPVITAKGLKMMNFSLIPSWSKDRKPKFATHNARIESLAEKAAWKKPLQSKRCLVPLTTFIEPIYINELAGNMVGFHTPDEQVLVAAGIYDEWLDKKTGEVLESFTIITSHALPFVEKVGHERSPVFLAAGTYTDWIKPGEQPAENLISFLKNASVQPDLAVEKDRPMRPGWEKRIPRD